MCLLYTPKKYTTAPKGPVKNKMMSQKTLATSVTEGKKTQATAIPIVMTNVDKPSIATMQATATTVKFPTLLPSNLCNGGVKTISTQINTKHTKVHAETENSLYVVFDLSQDGFIQSPLSMKDKANR
jgi:hypothetical protein